ncbi:MAG: hypothetical protein EON96_02560 [Caulobacteraceae bacterium]|nr:MAG: hypothetical protein EON96_02560 [Caulobacteraceae bacterium]
MEMAMRIWATIVLMVLSVLIGEYVLGSMSIAMLPGLPFLMLWYGAGAVLIRETVRRTSRGWPALILFAIAFALIEEGLLTQSLFNPDYLGMRLLDFGYIPALGTSLSWAFLVLGLHIFWSIGLSIGLAELAFRKERAVPWLGRIGTSVITVLLLLGAVFIAGVTYYQRPFIAHPGQIATVVLLSAAAITAGLAWPRPGSPTLGAAPKSIVLAAVSFVFGSAFLGVKYFGVPFTGPNATLQTGLAAAIAISAWALMYRLTYRRLWTDRHRFAFAAGGYGVYVWLGFYNSQGLHGPGDLLGHAILTGVVTLGILWLGWKIWRSDASAVVTQAQS